MNPDDPSSYPRRILLCVVGLSPQVVTETIFALTILQSPPFKPTEIYVITTRDGGERVILTLLDNESGAFFKLAQDYNLDLPKNAFVPDHVRVIHNNYGVPLDDIVTGEDNRAAADALSDFLRQLTEDSSAAIHVSIAGGRKTMGFFVGYALSLFGRQQDRLSHVLVPVEFEGHPQFFYPPPKPQVLFTRDNRPVRTDSARVSLADIPFVRLRHGVPQDLVAGTGSYARAVASVQQRLGPPELIIDLTKRQAIAAGQALPLPSVLFAWIAWFAERCRREGADASALHWSEADAADFLSIYESIRGAADPRVDRARASLIGGMTREYFEEKTARYNKLVRTVLGPRAGVYCLQPSGRRPRTRVGLRLPPEAIRFVGEDGPAP